jgi:hypothetical protein
MNAEVKRQEFIDQLSDYQDLNKDTFMEAAMIKIFTPHSAILELRRSCI